MSTSAAIADSLLRRAFGQRARPSDPQRTAQVRFGSSRAPRAKTRPAHRLAGVRTRGST